MTAVPIFPQTRPLELQDKPLLDGLFQKYPPAVSEFTFTNLFAWRKAYGFQVSALDGYVLVIAVKDKGLCVFDPLGEPSGKKKVMKDLFAREKDRIKFIRLPGPTAGLFEKEKGLTLREDRDNFDYLYKTTDLIGLKGKKFDGKRNFIKRFQDAQAFDYRTLSPENVQSCLSFQEEWCLAKDCLHTEGLEAERQAMRQMLENFQALGVRGAMIEIQGKVEAVTLGEPLNPETFVIHIEKANGNFIGIYQAVNQLFCASHAKEYLYVNREQDLGVAGLRKSKESYHPARLVKKYTLSID